MNLNHSDNGTNVRVFAIIVTYNASKWIDKCVSSISNSSIPEQIIIIDNNSSDNTVSIIRGGFPDVELIESKRNLGFGAANNIGLKKALEANADFVFLLNQDAYVNNETIEVLLNASTKHPEYGILSPFHYSYTGEAPEQYFLEWVMKHHAIGLDSDFRKGRMRNIYSTSFVHAACWLMPISIIEEVGGFDPLFHHYGEDNDYIQRLFYKNKLAGIVPFAKVFHQGSNEGLKSPEKNIPFLINQSLLLFKHPKASVKGAMLLFMKQLVRNHFKGYNSPLAKALRFNFWRINKMIGSRKKQTLPFAYLEI